ncbi:tetratricopeptide repeat protein [Solitalea canadensis]|uniref:Tetratricopeptide repeat protein n=1 Tax=Solitalea canadensis (strain ATCC 29591 / DSM 3403 / JCM 21819 / LMG 8368 / NBRC 15130 / NCIMB 12057 / USAM 9D) TaxID=929556 RepID=H8KQV4_SOLCM|nr:tetratricopeptide repeat protein [Solitalea canadensis]AFD06975.1 tetratricopeptide repeat protein [Solitalea canadensis DSM 3403]
MQNTRLEQLKQYLLNEPDDSFLKYAIATEYIKLDQLDEALNYFTELVTTDENYVGTYYHLGKLYEKLSKKDDAEATYKKGLMIARKAGKMHAAAELQQALNSVLGLDYEDD